MTFGQGLAFVFRAAWAFVIKAWWLALLPALPHVSFALVTLHARIPEGIVEPATIAVDFVGVVLSVMARYWVMRFIALGGNLAAALAVNRHSALTFAPLAIFFTTFWFGVGFTLEASPILGASLMLVIDILFAPWSVSAPSGSKHIGPLRSIRLAARKLPLSILFFLVALLPFGLLGELLGLPLYSSSGDVWISSVGLILIGLVVAGGEVIYVAAMFVIAYWMGVRTSHPDPLEHIFT